MTPEDITTQIAIQQEIDRLRAELRERMPANPAAYGSRVFSQTDEDGIISRIMLILGIDPAQSTFLEIGVGNGLVCNTHWLALQGARGVWLEGHSVNCAFIEAELPNLLRSGQSRLDLASEFVTLDSVPILIETVCRRLDTRAPDFFSIDIDGNDAAIATAALRHFQPKIICIEYNSKFPPPVSLCVPYDDARRWARDDFYGASLQFIVRAFGEQYDLVCCNLAGVNAFFVRADINRLAENDPAALYMPPRYELARLKTGFPAKFHWLRERLETEEHHRDSDTAAELPEI